MVTIDQALQFLNDAKLLIGGDAVLVLCLENSGITDHVIDRFVLNFDETNRYIEVVCNHPDIQLGDNL